jgi:hypothetical protein
MTDFLNGALTMGMCVVMLFFLRSWRETKDSLFLDPLRRARTHSLHPARQREGPADI